MVAAEENLVKPIKATKKQKIEIRAEEKITFLKLLNTLIEDKAGKIIKLEIRSVPITLIPITTTIAVRIANKTL